MMPVPIAASLLTATLPDSADTAAKVQAELQKVDRVIAGGKYGPDWNSWPACPVPDWYRNGKLGIFIHWGVYSVPAFGSEWYPRLMYLRGTQEFEHHVKTYGPQDRFGYKDFIPMFRAERFDANAWARLFKEAGARFVVPVAEHHDGFAMYDCSFSDWCAAKMGPKRDIVGELASAVRRQGLVFGVSSHRAEHWWFMNGGRQFDSDVQDPRYADFYGPAEPDGTQPDKAYLDNWLARSCELVDKYRPRLFWFDWWIEQPAFKPYLQRFGAYYYDRAAQRHEQVAINYKNRAFPARTAVLDLERGQLAGIAPRFWQTDTSIDKNSWGYVKQRDLKTAGEIVGDLVDIVSKNGAMLLNIGPKADGTIQAEERAILREIGRWLKINGEAIYGSRPWTVFGEGPTQVAGGMFTDTKRAAFTGQDARYTRKGDILYAILLAWPGKEAVLKSLGTAAGPAAGRITGVTLLGHRGALTWNQAGDALTVEMPAQKPCDYAYTLKITGLHLTARADNTGNG